MNTMWWLYFCNGNVLVGAAIIEARTLYHARLRAAAQGIGRAAEYNAGEEAEVELRLLVPRDCIGRLLSLQEARQVVDLVGARNPGGSPAREMTEGEKTV
jgi:hypothetical protein